MRVNPHLPAEDRLWLNVDRRGPGECWPWTGSLEDGYGRLRVASGKRMPAHRFAWTLVNGPVPDGMVMDHLCRNRACCNPAHVEPVSNRENLMRGDTHAARNSAKTRCIRGHDFTEENTYVDPLGRRCCKSCQSARRSERRDRIASGLEVIAPARTHCSQGHEFTGENTYVSPRGEVVCRKCRRIYRQHWRKARRMQAREGAQA